jgi:hypothetical protein
LGLLPRLLHRAIRRAEVRDADEQRARASSAARGPVPAARGAARLERTIAGAALVIAGAVWSGLSEPQWLGWAGSALGLLLLAVGRARAE